MERLTHPPSGRQTIQLLALSIARTHQRTDAFGLATQVTRNGLRSKLRKVQITRLDIETLSFRADLPRAIEHQRAHRKAQPFGQQEGPLVEAADAAVGRAGTLGEDDHRIALLDTGSEAFDECLVAIGGVAAVGIAHHPPEEGRTPHPRIGHHHHTRRKAQQNQNIDKRLVVGHHHRRSIKRFDGVFMQLHPRDGL